MRYEGLYPALRSECIQQFCAGYQRSWKNVDELKKGSTGWEQANSTSEGAVCTVPSTDLLFSCAVLNSKSQQLLTISQLSMWHYVKKARLGKSRQVNFLDLLQFFGCDYNSVIVSTFLQSSGSAARHSGVLCLDTSGQGWGCHGPGPSLAVSKKAQFYNFSPESDLLLGRKQLSRVRQWKRGCKDDLLSSKYISSLPFPSSWSC